MTTSQSYPQITALELNGLCNVLNSGYIKRTGKKDLIYQVTEKGYNISDAFKNDNQLDASMTPSQVIEMFDEGR